VIDGDRRLCYGELDRRATALARHLRARGVAAGDVVAVVISRSAALAIAFLGVLKAGAVYVAGRARATLLRASQR
jgi:non-ribosomal peptide synthetase component F